jgi:alpha-N-acetylglucosaminidase
VAGRAGTRGGRGRPRLGRGARASSPPLIMVVALLFTLQLVGCAAAAESVSAPHHVPGSGSSSPVRAVQDLLDRVLPGSRSHFALSIAPTCGEEMIQAPCFLLSDGADGKVHVTGTSASELSAGVGTYLMEFGQLTFGWPRGGGNHIFTPSPWPKVGGAPVIRKRSVPWSYIMNVCTHSYSLVWYSWAEWQQFIDWQALVGINLNLAMTGQEEVQYKVFRKLGLSDAAIRGWFNGPAFLTWSRGQNEYGAGVHGPLPRSWMQNQWTLQRQILARYRELGIVGQLPAFQGNVPVGLKELRKDANISAKGATGWLDSLDPLYLEVSDLWMQTLVEDFGTDHWYQLDGYLNGGTAPWLDNHVADDTPHATAVSASTFPPAPPPPPLGPIVADPAWVARGAKGYEGLNRTDPEAVWSFQGFAFVGWSTAQKAGWLKGFVDAVPDGRFNVIDMGYSGNGEWKKWNDASFFGADFVWTTLMNFGGTNGIKGNLTHMNEIPWAAIDAKQSVWGSGITSEGIDQNPALYDFILSNNFRDGPVDSIPGWLKARATRRYGLGASDADVDAAWELLSNSTDAMYQVDISVQDFTAVKNFPSGANWDWAGAPGGGKARKPSGMLCKTFRAWTSMIAAAEKVAPAKLTEPMRYDLVDLGRDVLARLTTPVSQTLASAFGDGNTTRPNAAAISSSGASFIELLLDLDTLVGSDQAFLLGSWLKMARALAGDGSEDCRPSPASPVKTCADFYEWNARAQLSTWCGGYATKHWNGLIKGFVVERTRRMMKAALAAAAAGKFFPKDEWQGIIDKAGQDFVLEFNVSYPEEPVGDAILLSRQMHSKYKAEFASCSASASAAAAGENVHTRGFFLKSDDDNDSGGIRRLK